MNIKDYTLRDMENDKSIYDIVIESLAREQSFLNLWKNNALLIHSDDYPQNVEETLLGYGQLSATQLIRKIIIKVMDRHAKYFQGYAQFIHYNDLLAYICIVLSTYITIDKLIRKFAVFTNIDHTKTYRIYALTCYHNISLKEDPADVLDYLDFEVIDNNTHQRKQGNYNIVITASKIFDFMLDNGASLSEYIENALNECLVHISIYTYAGPGGYHSGISEKPLDGDFKLKDMNQAIKQALFKGLI